MPDFAGLTALVSSYGPLGALLIIVLVFYRRDMLGQQKKISDARDKLITAIGENTTANNKLSTALADHEEHEKQMIESLGAKVEHAINNGFQNFLLHVRLTERNK